jgi:hypothetical protein
VGGVTKCRNAQLPMVITPVNDPPAFRLRRRHLSVEVNSILQFKDNIQISDVDAGNSQMFLELRCEIGTLSLSEQPQYLNTFAVLNGTGEADDTLSMIGTLSGL